MMRARFLLLMFMFSALVIITSEKVHIDPRSNSGFASGLLAGEAKLNFRQNL